METVEITLKNHPFFKDLPSEHLKFIVGCSSNAVFKSEEVILKEGQSADKFYLIQIGRAHV